MKPLSIQAVAFLAIKSRDDLAQWLGISDRKLRFLLYKLTDSDRYRTFPIRKKNGGIRHIDAPTDFLKRLQSKILAAMEELAPPTGIAKAYVKGRSILNHATLHRGQRWVLLADLESFFPSINFGRVRGAFKARPFNFSEEVATCLAQLCCKESKLPQGAPTSPVISNLICRKLDREIVALARTQKCVVSRYADDICFSTSLKEFPAPIAKIDGNEAVPGDDLIGILAKNGFVINRSKFRLVHRRARQMVTGLIVNKRISLSRRWKRQLRAILFAREKYGEVDSYKVISGWTNPSAIRNPSSSTESLIRGKAGFARWLDVAVGSNFVGSLHRAYSAQRQLLPRIAASMRFRLMTEGDSDVHHLQAALNDFQAAGNYLDLSPAFRNYSGDKGDADLWETLLRIAKADVPELTIGIFDCDNLPFMKARSVDAGGHVRLGKMVYAFFLAASSSSMRPPFCIESLYDRAQIQRLTADGRQIFFGDEFDATTGVDASGLYQREFPLKKSIVLSEQVLRLTDGFSSLLPKRKLAEMILASEEPFAGVSFAGFVPTFKALQQLIDAHE